MLQADLFREQFEIREKLVNIFLSKKTVQATKIEGRQKEQDGKWKGVVKKKKKGGYFRLILINLGHFKLSLVSLYFSSLCFYSLC